MLKRNAGAPSFSKLYHPDSGKTITIEDAEAVAVSSPARIRESERRIGRKSAKLAELKRELITLRMQLLGPYALGTITR